MENKLGKTEPGREGKGSVQSLTAATLPPLGTPESLAGRVDCAGISYTQLLPRKDWLQWTIIPILIVGAKNTLYRRLQPNGNTGSEQTAPDDPPRASLKNKSDLRLEQGPPTPHTLIHARLRSTSWGFCTGEWVCPRCFRLLHLRQRTSVHPGFNTTDHQKKQMEHRPKDTYNALK